MCNQVRTQMLRIRKFGENQSGYAAALLELLYLFCAASPESVFAKVMPILPSPVRTWAKTFCGAARVKKTKIPNAGVVATNVLAQFCV